MNRITIFIYGLICYLIGAFAYFIGLSSFLGNFGVIGSIDIGPEMPFLQALAINLGLILFFGLPHSLMARQSFKRRWTKLVPPAGRPFLRHAASFFDRYFRDEAPAGPRYSTSA